MEVYYKPSDIVWVKLGPFWWPGEVVDKTTVPELLIESLKKEPVAIVKYFDEDGFFEIVKTPDRIFPYNCERKHDFIKKGMDAFRAKNPKMASFPKDVSAAEIKTGGNANILSDPMFSTERKRNYAAEIFGTPNVKKPRESNKGRAIKSEPIITHRRFLGYDDYEARVLLPSPEETPQEEETPKEGPCKKFTCPICQFTTERLGILMKHTSCHMKDVGFVSRQPIKKPQKRKRRKALSDDDWSDDDKKTKTKRKYTKKKDDETLMADDEKSENDVSVNKDGAKRKPKKKITQTVVEEKKDICTDIIADWDDESNQEDPTADNTTLNGTQDIVDITRQDTTFVDSSFALNLTDEDDLHSTRITTEVVTEDTEKVKSTGDSTTHKADYISCFDFDEDEEETKIPDATSGRKIPRVIPISERPKTFELEDATADDEEEKKKKKILEESKELAKLTEPSNYEDKETENLEKTYQSLMESTENIELPDVPNILKNEQNFHSAKAVKYPDKPLGDSSEIIEAELVEVTETSENTEEILLEVEKITEKPETAEDVIVEVVEKLAEQSESIEYDEKKMDEEDVEETSTKRKRKRKSKYTKAPRRSTRSKPEITESDIDAELMKQYTESKNLEEQEKSAKIQVPLSVPSASEEITVGIEEKIQEKEETNSLNTNETQTNKPSLEIQEKESNLSDSNKIPDGDSVLLEKVVAVEEVLIDGIQDTQEVKTGVLEVPTEEIAIEQPLEISEEIVIPTETARTTEELSEKTVEESSEKTVEESSEKTVEESPEKSAETTVEPTETVVKVTANESNRSEDKTENAEESSPEPKRRKTTRGYSRSSKSRERPSQGTRRGRSADVEVPKSEESLSSALSESVSQKEQKKSVLIRKSTRWDRKLSNEDKETSGNDSSIDPIEEKSPTYEEINDVIFGKPEIKENVDSQHEEPIPEQKSETAVKSSTDAEEKIDSLPVTVHSELPPVEQEKALEQVEVTENSSTPQEQVVEEQITDETILDKKEKEKSLSEKTANERTVDEEKESKSSYRSPRKEKRSSRSGRDHKKDESSKTEDNSLLEVSHRSLRGDRSQRGSRRAIRSEDCNQEDNRILKEDDLTPKEDSSSHREGRRSLRGDTSSNQEDIQSSRKDDSSHRESKRSLRGDHSSHIEESSSHREGKRSLRGDNLSNKEESSSTQEDNHSLRKDNSSQIEETSSRRESKRSLRGDHSSRREGSPSIQDNQTLKKDNSSHKEKTSFHKENESSLRGDNSSQKEDSPTHKEDTSSNQGDIQLLKKDNTSQKEDASSRRESKRSLRGDTASKGEDTSSQEDDESLKKDNSSQKGETSHRESKRSLRGNTPSKREDTSNQEEDESLKKDNSSQKGETSRRESKRSLRGDTASKGEDTSSQEDDESPRKDNSSQKGETFHRESKRSLRGNTPSKREDTSNQEEDESLKKDNSSQKGETSRRESKRSLRGDTSSRREHSSSQKEDISNQEDKESLKKDLSSQKEETSRRDSKRSPRGDNSSQREDFSSDKESKRSLRGDNAPNREDISSNQEDKHSLRRDNTSLKEDTSPQSESRRSFRGENSSQRDKSSTNKEDKRSLKSDSSNKEEISSNQEENKSPRKDNSSQREDSSNHRESKRSLRGDNSSEKKDSSHRDGKRSLRGENSNREDNHSLIKDNSSQKEDGFSHRESKRSLRGDNSSNREDVSSNQEDNRSRDDNTSQKEDISSHKDDKRSPRADNSSHRSSRSGKRSSRQEKEKQDSSDGSKTLQPDESPIKQPKDSSSSRKSSSSKDSHSRKIEVSSNNYQEDDASRRSTKKDRKSSRTDQDSQKQKPVKEQEVDDRRDHNSSSRSSRRHGRSSRSNQESSSKDSLLLDKGKHESSSKKSAKTSEEVDPINALFLSPETVRKTKEQKREELKSIFSFDYDEEELKKRKTYGHKRKSKPSVPENTIEAGVTPITNIDVVSIETEEIPSTISMESVEKIDDETVIQSGSQKIEEQKLITSELEVSEQISLQTDEGNEVSKEITPEKKEICSVVEEKEAVCVPEVSATEVIQPMTEAEIKDVTEITIETKVNIETLNDKSVETQEDKASEIIHEEKTDSKDSKLENNDAKIEATESSLTDKVEKKEMPAKSTKLRKPRKPSRWDQIEKTDVDIIQEQSKLVLDATSKEENQHQILEAVKSTEEVHTSDVEPVKETTISPDSTELTLGIDESSQKEMNEIFSKKESDLADKNAQIELIFGSSPLPTLNENNIFIEAKEKPETVDEKQELTHSSEEKEKDETIVGDDSSHNSSFEQTNDLMESVESQVARITHYEEPVPKEEKSLIEHKVSIFDTPEKKEKPVHQQLDLLEDKIDVETDSASPSVSSKPEESVSYKSEPTTSAPKTKKTYLLSEQNKKEMAVEKSPEIVKEKIVSVQDIPVPPKSAEKTNEVATKLTNPKKRFVKSFKDFELNKRKEEESLEAEKSNKQEVKTETPSRLVGKSPIAFKLKKQFLSKISNIFDEADEKKETKLLPKLKPIKHDTLFSKKKEPVIVEKSETITASNSEATFVPQKKTENEKPEVVDVVNETVEDSSQNKPDDTKVPNVEHSFLRERLEPEKAKNSCQETVKENEEEVKELLTVDHSASEIPIAHENNSTSLSIGSILTKPEELDESKLVVPGQSAELNDDQIDVSKTEIITTNFPLDENKKEETEYVSIDGNLTVVSEQELAEGQVEITASMPSKKPMTLMNFSMDFSDDSTDASFEAFKNEKIQGIADSLDSKNVEEENKQKVQEEKIKPVEVKEIEQTVVSEEEKQNIDIKQKEESIVKEEKSVDTELNVTNVLEIESTSSCTATIQPSKKTDKTETKKEERHDISLEDILKSSMTYGKEKKQPTETKDVNKETVSILSEHVKITSKAPSETLATKSKGKDAEKSTFTKKNERKTQHSNAEETPKAIEPLVIYNTAKSSTVTDMCDLEDHIPSQIVCTKNALINEEVMKVAGINNELTKETTIQNAEPQMSKLLNRLTTDKKEDPISKIKATETELRTKELEVKPAKVEPSSSKNLLKAAIKNKTLANTSIVYPSKPVNKAIILSEKIIRPAREIAAAAGSSTKRTYEDVEDIEPYVITKSAKLEVKKDESPVSGAQMVLASSLPKLVPNSPKQFIYNAASKQIISYRKSASGKAKILNQTIIRPASESVQNKAIAEDNVDFDINSMPIVLSDELLTPETLENIPIVLGEQPTKASPSSENMKIVIEKKPQSNSKLMTKTAAISSASAVNSPTIRMPMVKRTTPKILQAPKPTQKLIRQVNPSVSTKSSKFVVVSDSPSRPGQVIKKQTNVVRKTAPLTSTTSSTPGNPSESTGHKIMIFTNQQGKQQRLLLTPAQQKLFGMQVAGKTVVKGATVAQKSQLAKVQNSSLPSTSKLLGQNQQSAKQMKTAVGTTVATPPNMKIVPPRRSQKVLIPGSQPAKPPQQKTILITNQHGQTVRKIQGTNDALLDKQVAEQLEAIKVSSMKAQMKQHEASVRASVANKPVQGASRKAVVKRSEPKQTIVSQTRPTHLATSTISGPSRFTEQQVPPLSPIKPEKKAEEVLKQTTPAKPAPTKPERPLHQLVIQDNAGNQTTITEGQILALPSETVDGQPQSYMLVTLDETGNLTPLNNEALMSLDPSLAGLTGGDLSNMVLQMDAGASKGNLSQTAQLQAAAPTIVQEKPKQEVQQPVAPLKPVEQVVPSLEQPAAQVQVTCNINGEPGQQIILTGDPAATQKFLDSLSDGSTDLANILAGAEGNSFLIQADGQQILINTEPSDAGLLRQNTSIVEPPEQRSPMFSTHPVKNQDILAAALADTDVFQQDHVSSQGKLHSQLSPGQSLFPMNVGNVLETSLTLNSPIMTPLEVPSTHSKRIPDEEADILTTHVPKNVDLPITITDPNISQTVSHQQVLMAGDLQSNLELSLPISETSLCVTSGMNSPSFVYSLPSLDVAEHTEINQKTYSSSMPLLTEDIEESPSFVPLPPKVSELQRSAAFTRTESPVVSTKKDGISETMSTRRLMTTSNTFMEEGLCALGGEMCSSLEPPPEMFDVPMESDGLNFLNKSQNESKEKSAPVNSGLLMDDNSSEMPVQSRIAVEFKDSSQSSDSSSSVSQDKTL